MTIKLNHTIVYSRDKQAAAGFLADLFGLPAPTRYGPFLGVEVGNEVTLDYYDAGGDIAPQHYAFLVSEAEFDQIFGRIRERGLDFWRTLTSRATARSTVTMAAAGSISRTPAAT